MLLKLPALEKGVVFSRDFNDCLVKNQAGNFYKIHFSKKNTKVYVGDQVIFALNSKQKENTGYDGKLIEILAAKNAFYRINYAKQKKIIAHNCSQVVLILAYLPKPHFLMVDALFALCQKLKLPLLLVFNKSDLDKQGLYDKALENYQKIGIICLKTSIYESKSLEKLRSYLLGQSSVFFGTSGVGKSSLIQYFFVDENVKTKALIDKKLLGAHTTSQAKMYQKQNITLIDTAGIGNSTISYFDKKQLMHLFVEFKNHITNCQFRDCLHQEDSPNCAINLAVNQGKIDAKRLQNYRILLRNFCFKD